MMSRLSKALLLGILTGFIGLILSLVPLNFDLVPFSLDLEENIGLDILFKLRGVRQPPSDVVIISMEKASADKLNLPRDTRKWPRYIHARLIERLKRQGATAIAFDVLFDEPRAAEEDRVFAAAISKARNVVLCEYLRSEKVPLTKQAEAGLSPRQVSIVQFILPTPALEQSAAALAPFPLPKVPVKVSQYWSFNPGAGDIPTLPVVAFQVFAMQQYDQFIRLIETVNPQRGGELRGDWNEIANAGKIRKSIRAIREIFENEPLLAEKMLNELASSERLHDDDREHQIIRSLIKMYQGPHSQYLNFYGPPRTITTIPYYQMLQPEDSGAGHQPIDVKGKVVFVGLSESIPSEQRDGFYTVFSQRDGMDISGVEIAATAFANLLEDMPVRPIGFRVHLMVILIWGIVIGTFCRLFEAPVAGLGTVGLSILYLIMARRQFAIDGSWYPLFFPLVVQTCLAFFGSVLWKHIDSNRERKHIRKVFGYYLPNDVVDRLMENIADRDISNQLVYGICLSTDAERYTSLSETMAPKELSRIMNNYYETVFKPIGEHGGHVSNVIGDSMMAIWVMPQPDPSLKGQACLAALDIVGGLCHISDHSHNPQLPTRIGLHCGPILLGNVGAIDHFEYRPIGDIVNTASRLEGLNKYLGTRILVSAEIVNQLEGFLTREIGEFLLAGKSKSVVVHELLCRLNDADDRQKAANALFAEGLNAFRKQSWDDAIEKFSESAKNAEGDGPVRFYVWLCEHHKKNPPGESWDGIVKMDKK